MVRQTLFRIAAQFLIERPAKTRTLEQLANSLERSATKLAELNAAAADTPANRKQLSHIIGIERWGQRRLKVALGEPQTRDEYDSYAPSLDDTVAEMRQALQTTRSETVAVVRQIVARGNDGSTLVEHNDFGPMSVRGWAVYLKAHAERESTRLK